MIRMHLRHNAFKQFDGLVNCGAALMPEARQWEISPSPILWFVRKLNQ